MTDTSIAFSESAVRVLEDAAYRRGQEDFRERARKAVRDERLVDKTNDPADEAYDHAIRDAELAVAELEIQPMPERCI